MIAKLTVDKNGQNGLEPAFDKNNVNVYGFLAEWADGSRGQNDWATFGYSTGWRYANKNPFATKFNYDDPKLAKTAQWPADPSDKSYATKLDVQSTLARSEVLANNGCALTTLGSFNPASYKGKIDQFRVRVPAGRSGGTQVCDQRPVGRHLRGRQAQGPDMEVGQVPRLRGLPERGRRDGRALARHHGGLGDVGRSAREGRLNAKVFLDEQQTNDGTFIIPISYHRTEITPIVQDAIQNAALGPQDAKSALRNANDQVKPLFK